MFILRRTVRGLLLYFWGLKCTNCTTYSGEPTILNFIHCTATTYQKEGLAMKLGLGSRFARLEGPEVEVLRVRRLGSNSSINSTSSCSSTSWSRMHLTEYWPNTQSYKRGWFFLKCCEIRDKNKTLKLLVLLPAFLSVSHFTYQLLAQLMRCSRLLKRTPSPQNLSQPP